MGLLLGAARGRLWDLVQEAGGLLYPEPCVMARELRRTPAKLQQMGCSLLCSRIFFMLCVEKSSNPCLLYEAL